MLTKGNISKKALRKANVFAKDTSCSDGFPDNPQNL